VVIRTRYQRYIGEFVLHCHVLDHEDQGMMQNVSVMLPSDIGKAKAAASPKH
jgi:L-ascorbate oxidase